MSKNNGGPAFARPKSPKGLYTDSEVPGAQTGMSLRDYFAAKAMQAIITGNKADECSLGLGAAKDAYAMADAMIAAREAKS